MTETTQTTLTPKLKCSHKGCEQEAVFRVGYLNKAKALCIRHYAEHLKRTTNNTLGAKNE